MTTSARRTLPGSDALALRALTQCAAWTYHAFADGPLAGILMHMVTDPASLLQKGEHAAARASVRLVLRDGTIFVVLATAPRSSLQAALMLVGRTLAGRTYDDAAFKALDGELAAALQGAGLASARIILQRNASLLPAPLLGPDQLARMALQGGEGTVPAHVMDLLRQAGALDAPAVQAYIAALEEHARGYCVDGRAHLAVYNWIAAARGHSRYRVQALLALPWLLPLMTAPGPAWCGAAGIQRAIDTGAALHDAVAQACGVPREVVRWLGRRALPASWTLDPRRAQHLLTLLSWLAPERRPRMPDEFKALQARAIALAAALDYRGDAGAPMALNRIGPCMRQWLAQGEGPAVQQRTLALADAKDFLRALFDGVRSLDGLDDAAADAWVLRWCAGGRVARLLALSASWHAALLLAWEAELSASSLPWPAVLPEPWITANRTAIELNSRELLRREGHALAHCVGSYAPDCTSGDSVIVSLRTAAGVPVSTVELTLEGSPPVLLIRQHRAAQNAAPGADCTRALAALLRHLNRAEQLVHREQRRTYQQAHRHHANRARFKFTPEAQLAARRLATPVVATLDRVAAHAQ